MKKKIFSLFGVVLLILGTLLVTANAMTRSEFDLKLAELQKTYYHGSRWEKSFDGGIQCYGYANMISYNVFGSSAKYWNKSYDLSGVKPGDVIQYGNTTGNGHTIFVTNVSGDTITYTDCNSDYKLTVKWGNTVSKSSNRLWSYGFSYRCVAPNLDSYADIGTGIYGIILNKACWKPIEVCDDDYVRLGTENGTARQVWRFDRESDGSYKITSAQNGKVLDVYDNGTENGTQILTWSDKGANNQRWFIYNQGDGYILQPRHTKSVLDLRGNDSSDGATIELWERHNGPAEIFAIYRGNEVQLSSPVLTVTPGSSVSNTVFNWSEVYGEKRYDVKIWNGTYWVGDAYHIEWGAKKPYEIKLPPGHYEAYVDAANELQAKMSNVVTFNISSPSMSSKVIVSAYSYDISATIKNPPSKAVYAAAIYSSDNKLIDIISSNLTNGAEVVSVKIPRYANAEYIKTYLWEDLNSLQPVAESEKIIL